jgi:ABC-2 type transport system ATP-binding protein
VALTVDRTPSVRREVLRVPGSPGSDGRKVTLDATLFLPDTRRPAPAVVLAHGFGGSKDDETGEALALARRGYVVLAYSARGFGRSEGQISLNSPDYEVRDAQRMIDLLAARQEVLVDHPGDPRVGFAGTSYGGALSLLVAGYDRRVDAIVPMFTWNDLRSALFPQAAQNGTGAFSPGAFKRVWAGAFFGAGGAQGAGGPAGPATAGLPPGTCGRFAAEVCAAYADVAVTGNPGQRLLELLAASSPARVLYQIHAPTLLIQGESDSLFPLDEAVANARGIAAAGTPVKVVWAAGGHDAGGGPTDRIRRLTAKWLGRYLHQDGSPPDTRFEYTQTDARAGAGSVPEGRVHVAAGLPGLAGAAPAAATRIGLHGTAQTVVAPPGGNPAAVSSLPGLGAALRLAGSRFGELPGQHARFESDPLPRRARLAGTPNVTLELRATSSDATLFAKLYDVAPDGSATLPQRLAAPLRLTGLRPGTTSKVRVALPTVVHEFDAGHRLRLVVASTDQGYQLPLDPRTYMVALADDRALSLPLAPPGPAATGTARGWLVGLSLLVLLVGGGVALWRRGRSRTAAGPDPALTEVPLVVNGLGKTYEDGFAAVSGLSFRVEAGQVLGLLGSNGAGKTTTLRMLTGLIQPTTGTIRVFGQRITPGAPVLSRIGALIEGPGFLPHLSGMENLQLYWRATGRPAEDARFDEALELTAMTAVVHRKVRTYSHGMRQRLAIAQAMLGQPDLLVLDEPTDGLDPPQIRALREALVAYAARGRTVIVSSHLLAEVEQTCTSCVVMHRGRLVAQGTVAELVATAGPVVVDVDDPARAATVAHGLPGVRTISTTTGGIVVDLDGADRGELVRTLVHAGLAVDRVAPQHGLEAAFLQLIEDR